jgi:hypothetical protein
LDRGVRRLLGMWIFVKKDLADAFFLLLEEEEKDHMTVTQNGRNAGDIDDETLTVATLGTTQQLAQVGQVIALEAFKVSIFYPCLFALCVLFYSFLY